MPVATIPRTALPREVLRQTLDALDRGEPVVVATVVARHGSTPSTPGQKLALFVDGSAIGTVGGGAVEHVVLDAMRKAIGSPTASPRVETFRLGASLGMCCGGTVDVLIEPTLPLVAVVVVGAGHVGVFTAPLLASLGFSVTLVDAREEAADRARLPRPLANLQGAPPAIDEAPGIRLVHAEHDEPEVLEGLPASLARAAFVVMTHDHQLDQTAIEWALARGFGFVGGVGSRAKAARTTARLEAKGVPLADIQRVRMPLGADIAARSPAEIGVSIAAELIAWRASLSPRRSVAPEDAPGS